MVLCITVTAEFNSLSPGSSCSDCSEKCSLDWALSSSHDILRGVLVLGMGYMGMYMQGELMISVLQFNSFLIYEVLQVLMYVYLTKHLVSYVILCVFVYLSLII